MTTSIPRSEYPRPQFARRDWLCLNGEWQFEIDSGDSGLERGLRETPLKDRIQVPFCPESPLSGIGNPDFLNAVWYRREVEIPKDWEGREVLLHFQAVDYDTTVWVNGVEVARHRGGYTPITCELSGVAKPGQTATIVLRARDFNREPKARGKQASLYDNNGCDYTRTTGIWQTVWMEPVSAAHFNRPKITPDVSRSLFRVDLPMRGGKPGMLVKAVLKDDRGEVASASCKLGLDFSPLLELSVPADRRRLWQPGSAYLYYFDFQLLDEAGHVLDEARSYAGLRSVALDGKKVLINGKPVFQRLVLDQGFYPDGIYTAPSDEALVRDITLSMEAGFNGARLHQKVFEERFLYHCDRLGYLVWGEFPDWGVGGNGPSHDHQKPTAAFLSQWLEELERDYSHPAIIGWCPLNETWQTLTDRISTLDEVTWAMFLAARMDPTRPVLDTSGYSHRVPVADIYDCHDYEQNPEKFAQNHAGTREDKPYVNHGWPEKNNQFSIPYRGQPFFVSEFGGIWWNPKAAADEYSWGYGDRVKNIDEWYARFQGLCDVLLDDPSMFGYCYTQLTDVFQEQNGIYYFNRESKFDMQRVHAIQTRKAAIEG
jgi:beta-galactosidase/beta-glucuronidase